MSIKEVKHENNIITILTACPFCNNSNKPITTTVENWIKYDDGAKVQVAFPELTSQQREEIVTGICQPCWDKTFGEEEPDKIVFHKTEAIYDPPFDIKEQE